MSGTFKIKLNNLGTFVRVRVLVPVLVCARVSVDGAENYPGTAVLLFLSSSARLSYTTGPSHSAKLLSHALHVHNLPPQRKSVLRFFVSQRCPKSANVVFFNRRTEPPLGQYSYCKSVYSYVLYCCAGCIFFVRMLASGMP